MMNNSQIGMWKLTSVCPCLCVSSGIVALKEKCGGLDFSLDYDYLMGVIKKAPKKKKIVMTKISFMSLARALQTNQWDRLGEIEEITRSIDLRFDPKRIYRDNPQNGGDLIERKFKSEPLDVSIINMEAQK